VAVSSYTTADVRLGYAFGARIEQGFLSGVTVSASVQNLFDREPPNTAIIRLDQDMGFDPTNAYPMGRLIGIQLIKAW
jgi:outer membrane receptor protein involved in Fe transport